MPKFSVIVPVYKVEKYIRQCVESLLKQSYKDFEIILIDDGSPDECPRICDEYEKKDNRVHVIHKKNEGVSLARQKGIEISTGEYLVFVDSDDEVTEDFFETIVKYTYVDVIRFGCLVEQENGIIKYRFPKEKNGLYKKHDIEQNIFPYLIQSDLAEYYCPSLWRHVFKRDLFISNMVKDKKIKIGEDGACVIPCIYQANTMFCIHKCLYVYKYNETSVTKAKNVFEWDDPRLIYLHLNEKLDVKKYDFQAQIYRKILHELFSVVVSQFNRKEKYKVIVQDIRENLQDEIYAKAIKNAKFKSWNGKAIMFIFKYRLFWVAKLYHILKVRRTINND